MPHSLKHALALLCAVLMMCALSACEAEADLTGGDSALDTASDTPADTGQDTTADSALDTAADQGDDAAADQGSDVGQDATADTGQDTPADTGQDVPTDTGQDTQMDTGQDTGQDTMMDVDPGDPYAQARQDCVDEINMYRATLGLPPYQRWTSAESCTDGEAESDAMTGTPHGAFGACGEWAQNECPGWSSVESIISGCLASMWAEGPPNEDPCTGQCFQDHGHWISMSSTSYSKVACGFYTTPSGQVWAIQNFQ